MTQPNVTQEDTDKIYNHILECLKQGRQPGTYKQMGLATGVSSRNIGAVVSYLCSVDELEASRPPNAVKYSPLQYDIPGYDFSTRTAAPTSKEEAFQAIGIADRRLVYEAMDNIQRLHKEGFNITEIVKLVPDHIDGKGWSETSIAQVIKNTRPNYAYALSKKL